MLTPQYMANALVRSSSNIVKQEPIKSKKWRIWECLSDSNTSGLEEKIRVLGVEPMTFRITSPDAVPLSYRRLVGGKTTKLWVYVTNQWRIQTFRWGRGWGGWVSQKTFFRNFRPQFGLKIRGEGPDRAPRASPLDLPLQTSCILLGLECHCSMHDVFPDLCFWSLASGGLEKSPAR